MNNSKIVHDFIVNNIEQHKRDIAFVLSEKFKFSRQRANYYLRKEIADGVIIKTGKTRNSRYFLVGGKYIQFVEQINPDLAEDKIWSKYVKPMILPYSDNIYSICIYGFTEIFNNAIDHSDGSIIFTRVSIEDNKLSITVMDNGVGIFRKIQKALNLDSIKESILHLSKGKFTTDPSKHTGEGIFFTSRLFDSFSIASDDVYYTFQDEDWFLSPEKNGDFGDGTSINMTISLDSKKVSKEIFDEYADQEIGFSKTIVGVALSSDPRDPHVSRSQAKRLLMGLSKFKTIVLNFKGVDVVGQAFVDEIFRVFQNEHPNISIHSIHTNDGIDSMIKRGSVKR